jgi:uncharacterized protein (DUF488 family)
VARAHQLLTIGHSTHPVERFIGLLRRHDVELLCDVRRYPGSRRNPQFNASALASALEAEDIAYEGLGEELGGRRRPRPDSPNTGWRVAAFRGYADYMETEEFASGLRRLAELAAARRAAVMCAEGDWRRCHRRLIADALTERGWRVLHILPDARIQEHQPSLV